MLFKKRKVNSMAGYDGSLKFDTAIDEKGFNSGIKKLSDLGKSGAAAAGKALAGVTAALGAGAVSYTI